MVKNPNKFLVSFKLTPKKTLISIFVASTLTLITTKCGISEDNVLRFYNEIKKMIKPNVFNQNNILNEFDNQLNNRITNNSKLIKYKIKTEIDDSIARYKVNENKTRTINMKNKNILEEIDKPKYDHLQKLIIENAVYYEFSDGTMGIRGAWVAPDPREIPLE
jgi:hypothetical protein